MVDGPIGSGESGNAPEKMKRREKGKASKQRPSSDCADAPPLPPMADPSPRATPDRNPGGGGGEHEADAGLFSGAHTPSEDPGDSASSSDSESSDAAGESPRWAGAATSFRLFSESMLRMELAEAEMAKAREASRLEAERQRAELEGEMTRMLLQTQLQIATVVAGKSQGGGRKRKRVEDEDRPSASTREGALLLSLLHCNLFF